MWKELINGYNEGGRAGNRTFILKKILLKNSLLLAALLGCLQMPPGDSRWLQMAPDGSRWLQMAPDGSRWFQMWFQVVPGGPRGTVKDVGSES